MHLFRKYPFYRQLDQMDCGPVCLKMVAKYHGQHFADETLRNLAGIVKTGVSISNLKDAAEKIGFKALVLKVDYSTLHNEVPGPCIAYWNRSHYIVVYRTTEKYVTIADPSCGLLKVDRSKFIKSWCNSDNSDEGIILGLEPTSHFYSFKRKKNNTRSIGFLVGYFKPFYKYFHQLFLGLLVGGLLQLILPFLAQSIVDYGIRLKDINIIYLILLGQITLFVSRYLVEVLRSWILLHVTTRVNIKLIFDFLSKLIGLPLSFFDTKNTGDIFQRM